MAEPFLDLGDVGLMGERMGGSDGPQGAAEVDRTRRAGDGLLRISQNLYFLSPGARPKRHPSSYRRGLIGYTI